MVDRVAGKQATQNFFERIARWRASTAKAKKRTSSRKVPSAPPATSRWQRALLLGIEIAACLGTALVLVIVGLGRASQRFAGADWWASLLPFAASILAMLAVAALLLRLWLPLRQWLETKITILPATVAVLLAIAAWRFSARQEFATEVDNLRSLVGGSAEAERNTIAHQVYAAYRRSDLGQTQRILDRAVVYEPTIREAAETYGVDAEVLVGIGATESSFHPRDSKDGGRGLFQITVPPKSAVELVQKRLQRSSLDPLNQRHNAFLAAATLRHYLAEMHDDLFLGLLAYNIGPSNGGLRSIMQQYGARDFVTIQPYLQNLPRDYPVRVLAAALAYRLQRLEGKLPRYEEGSNAARIQSIGIPGLRELPKGARSVLRRDTSTAKDHSAL